MACFLRENGARSLLTLPMIVQLRLQQKWRGGEREKKKKEEVAVCAALEKTTLSHSNKVFTKQREKEKKERRGESRDGNPSSPWSRRLVVDYLSSGLDVKRQHDPAASHRETIIDTHTVITTHKHPGLLTAPTAPLYNRLFLTLTSTVPSLPPSSVGP